MIKHVLFCKLANYSEEGCEKLQEVFLSMNGNVPMARQVRSYVDFMHSERSYDVILEVALDSKEALEGYQNDAFHCDKVKAYVKSVTSETIVIDYEYDEPLIPFL